MLCANNLCSALLEFSKIDNLLFNAPTKITFISTTFVGVLQTTANWQIPNWFNNIRRLHCLWMCSAAINVLFIFEMKSQIIFVYNKSPFKRFYQHIENVLNWSFLIKKTHLLFIHFVLASFARINLLEVTDKIRIFKKFQNESANVNSKQINNNKIDSISDSKSNFRK